MIQIIFQNIDIVSHYYLMRHFEFGHIRVKCLTIKRTNKIKK